MEEDMTAIVIVAVGGFIGWRMGRWLGDVVTRAAWRRLRRGFGP